MPLLKAGSPKACCQGLCPAVSFLRWRLHNLSQQRDMVLGHPHDEKIFCYVQMEFPMFQFVLIASCLVTVHHWKEPDSVLFAAPLGYLYKSITLECLFSRLNIPILLASPHMRDALVLSSSSWPFTELTSVCPCHSYAGESRARPITSDTGSSRLRINPLNLMAVSFLLPSPRDCRLSLLQTCIAGSWPVWHPPALAGPSL